MTWVFTANSPGMSRSASRSAMLTLAGCFIHFFALGSGLAPFVCVKALGGLSSSIRPQQPLLYVFWATNAVTELAALPRLLPGKHILSTPALVGTVLLVFAAGAAATFTKVFALWIIMLLISCSANAIVTAQLVFLLREFRRQCKNRRAHGMFILVTPLSLALWTAFPICWILAQLSLISPVTEETCWVLLSLATKIAIGVMLIFGSLDQIGQESVNAAILAGIETHRKITEGRDESKRLFLRCVKGENVCKVRHGQQPIHTTPSAPWAQLHSPRAPRPSSERPTRS